MTAYKILLSFAYYGVSYLREWRKTIGRPAVNSPVYWYRRKRMRDMNLNANYSQGYNKIYC